MRPRIAVLALAIVAMSTPARAGDKPVTTHAVVDEIVYGKNHVLVLLEGHRKKGEFGCEDPYYRIEAERFGDTFERVVALVAEAAMHGAKLAFVVERCEEDDKEGASIVSRVKVDFAGDHQGRPGSYR